MTKVKVGINGYGTIGKRAALLAPRELPVGVVTAITGVPLFVILLRKSLR